MTGSRPTLGGRLAAAGWQPLTQPVGKLSMPEEGFEKSSVQLRFVHAGIRNPTRAGRSSASRRC